MEELKNDFGGNAKRKPSQDEAGRQQQLKNDLDTINKQREELFQEKAKRDV